MSVILVCEEFVSAFGSRFMNYIYCSECNTVDFDAQFAYYFHGTTCCVTDHPDNQVSTVQYQLSLKGSGDFCRLGCCDFSQKWDKHTCKRTERS